MDNYKGYKIRTGFLSGNLVEKNGYDEYESAQNYKHLVKEALEREYTGADIYIELGYSNGRIPQDFITKVYSADGDENPDELNFEVDRIAHQIFINTERWLVPSTEGI